MSIPSFSIKRPVATMMIIISMVALGVLTLVNLKAERLPEFDIPVASIYTNWTGTSPEDMEKLVTREIEDALPSVEGITKITTSSTTGRSVVTVEFEYGTDIDDKTNDLVTEISRIKGDLPDDADDSIVRKSGSNGDMVMLVSVIGDDLVEVKSFAENTLEPRLERIDGVGEITVRGGYEKEVLIDIDPDKLAGYGLSITDIYSTIQNASVNFPAGYLREGDKEFLVRVFGEAETLEEVKNIVIKNDGEQVLYLTDIADVRLDVKDPDDYGRTNGKSNVLVFIEKSDTGNIIDIAKTVREELKELEPSLPEGTSFAINVDASEDVSNSIDSVVNSAMTGLILAALVLFVFLKDLRATLIIAVSIPVSVIATFSMFGAKGMTLNLISLMGLSLGVGMLVDNSIVVLDNIFRHLTEYKKDRITAARDGATEMVVPIIASTATTVAVFLPIVVREGLAKEIFHDMSFSITFSLIASLIVAVTFVPMVSSRVLSSDIKIDAEGKVIKGVKKVYTRIIQFALRRRKTIIVGAIATFIIILKVGTSVVGGGFFPTTDDGIYTIVGDIPSGLNVDKVDRIARVFEEVAKNDPATQIYSTSVDTSDTTVNVIIGKPNERDESVFEIVERVRKQLAGRIPDVNVSVVPKFVRGAGGSDLTVNLQSDDEGVLENFAAQLVDKMKVTEGLVDVTSSLAGGNPEARIIIDRRKLEYYGVNVSDLTYATSYQIKGGAPVTIKTGSEELDVTVQLQKRYRESLDLLMDSRINTSDGNIVKLKDIASLQTVEGQAEIDKEDSIRKIEITSNISDGYDLVTSQEKVEELIKGMNPPTSLKYSFGGDGEDLKDVVGQLVFAFMVAIFLIYFILAAQFESYILPFIVMGSVPLSVAGVYIGLMVTGQDTNVMVFVGIIMLAGIVVNNAIVLIDYMNHLRDQGRDLHDLVVEACKTRLRPIVMTSMTTIFGMVPLALGIGQGSEIYKGMAIAVIFGLTFSTLLTLVFIPTLYSIYVEFQDKLEEKKRRKKKAKGNKES